MTIYRKMPFKAVTKNKRAYKNRKALLCNSRLYTDFVVDTMEKIADLPEGYQYNALSWTANRATIDYLLAHMDSMVWLNYSPRCDDTLQDHEYYIDEATMFEAEI